MVTVFVTKQIAADGLPLTDSGDEDSAHSDWNQQGSQWLGRSRLELSLTVQSKCSVTSGSGVLSSQDWLLYFSQISLSNLHLYSHCEKKKNNCTTLILTGSECGSVHDSGACLHGCGQANDIPISMNLCANSYDEKKNLLKEVWFASLVSFYLPRYVM